MVGRLWAGASGHPLLVGQEKFLFSKTSKPSVGHTQPSVQWVSIVSLRFMLVSARLTESITFVLNVYVISVRFSVIFGAPIKSYSVRSNNTSPTCIEAFMTKQPRKQRFSDILDIRLVSVRFGSVQCATGLASTFQRYRK